MFEPRTHARHRFGGCNSSGRSESSVVPSFAPLKQQAVNFRAWHAMMPPRRHHGLDLVLVDPLFQSWVAHSQFSGSFRNVQEFHELTLIKCSFWNNCIRINTI